VCVFVVCVCVCVCVREREIERQNLVEGLNPFSAHQERPYLQAFELCLFLCNITDTFILRKNNPSTDDHCICIKVWTVKYILNMDMCL